MFEIIDSEGNEVATAETLKGAKTGVDTLLREGYDVLAIDAADGRRVYTCWLDEHGNVFRQSGDDTRDLRGRAA